MSGLDVVSLFAGVGGIDLAAHRAGMTTRLLCEKDLRRIGGQRLTHGPDDNAAQAGHLIVGALTARYGKGTDSDATDALVVGVLGQHAHTLTAEGADAGEDGTGRGTPVVSIDMRNAARSSGTGVGTQGTGIATDGTSYGLSAATRAIPAVAYAPDHAATLTAGIASEGVSAPGRRQEDDTNLIAYPLAVRGREGGADLEAGEPGDPMFALRAGDGGSSRSQLVAVHENQRGELNTQPDIALNTGGGKPGQGYPAVTAGVIVRRYRQMGNSVAVPVFAWVLSRLAAADAEMNEAVA